MASINNSIQRHVVVLGINHTCSTVDIRDKLIFRENQLKEAYAALGTCVDVCESLILSTCNRVEIYAVVTDTSRARFTLLKMLSSFHSIPVEFFELYTYFYSCHQAIEHLYKVVSSLDSLVVGEDQVLSQIKNAYRKAWEYGATGQLFNKLFHFAITAGKKVRAETKISEGIVSIASAAVDLAAKITGNIDNSNAMIIGAGKMSKLTASHLKTSGIKKLYFANRTREHAAEMAAQFGGTPISIIDLSDILPECDIVIASTSAPHFILFPEMIRDAMKKRNNRALFLIDIAAPRDIDPRAGAIPNVFLYNIDDLTRVVNENTRSRMDEIQKVKAIIFDEMSKYLEWYASLKILPTLVNLRKNFEAIRDSELQRFSSELASLSPEQRNIIHQIIDSFTVKLLHTPSKALKENSEGGRNVYLADALIDLFNLRTSNDE